MRYLRPISSYLLILLVPLTYYSYSKSLAIPPTEIFDQSITDAPKQSNTKAPSFTLNYLDQTYQVYPHAEYELHGLVVSHNNPEGFGDIYHDSSSVDFRDLCLVWGDNLDPELLKKVKFSSRAWTCVFQTKDLQTFQAFQQDQLSNTHLITDNLSIRDQIKQVKIGDQVYLSGLLADYHPTGHPKLKRQTSLTRKDQGNGACEVLYVQDFKLIKTGNQFWRKIYQFALASLICLLVLKLLIFLFLPIKYYKNNFK